MPSTLPFSDGVMPTSLDPTLAPEGKHVVSLFTQWVPHEWSEEPHRDELEAYADRVIAGYDELAPGFADSVLHRQVIGPYEMEHEWGLIGGNIFHGELSAEQLFHMRPGARLRRLPHADPRPVPMLQRHARRRRRHAASRPTTASERSSETASASTRSRPKGTTTMTEQRHDVPVLLRQWYRKSPYYQRTVEAGCTSWDLYNHMLIPTLYDDDLKEYWHLLNDVTLWDVAVERQVEITGPDAARFTQLLTPRDLSATQVGQCKYVLICAPDGGIVNDPILLKLAEDHFWLSLADSDALLYAVGVQAFAGMDVTIREPDVSPLQVQGPRSKHVIRKLFGDDVMNLKYYWCTRDRARRHPGRGVAHRVDAARSATRSTCATRSRGIDLWDEVMDAGQEFDIRPIAPSDQRRMEAGIFNYGNDMDITNNPFEVTGLGAAGRARQRQRVRLAATRSSGSRPRACRAEAGRREDRRRRRCRMWLEDFWPVTKDGARSGG